MTRIEKRAWRVASLLDSVPYPHDGGGSPTASIEGMSKFQHDMRKILPLVKNALRNIASDPEMFEDCMADAELYVKNRNERNWE